MHKEFSGKNLRRRCFSGQDLIGANFTKSDLTGADFSNADIRSANFTHATLIRTNFSGAKAGLRLRWVIFLIIVSSFLAFLSGLLSAVAGAWSGYLLSSSTSNQVAGVIIITGSLFFISIILKEGLQAIPEALGISGVIVVILTIVGALAGNASLPVSVMAGWSGVVIGAGAGIVTLALTLAVIASTAIFVVWAGAVAGGMALALSVSIAVVASAIGSVAVEILTGTGSFSVTLAVGLVSAYVGRQALAGEEKHAFLREMAIAFATIGGTNFRDANLTDADFTQATLKSTDFREANLTRTCWYCCKMLDRVRPGMTYLKNAQARQLLTKRQGKYRNFDYQDLRGINLKGANVEGFSFIGANLNHANLQGADLSRAILKQTQLEGADLTEATLTGACIEDWGITNTTKLENVHCEYVYMQVSNGADPEHQMRKPNDKESKFGEGEFTDFIKPYFDTLDLYHRKEADPRSISIALKNLADNHPDAQLKFVAIEWRGEGLNIRYTTAPDVDKSELNHDYFQDYARIRKELLGSFQLKLAEKNAEINTMKGMIDKFMQTGTHQSTTIQAKTIQVIQGELIVTENRDISINAGDNANITGLSSGDGVVNLGTISGNVTNAINQLSEPPESGQPNLKSLLTQLQQAIQADTDLSDPDKSDLLEQVQALAEAKQTEEPAKREGLARRAMKIFDATLKSLPDTAKIAEACSKLLPLILKALGFPS